MNQRDFILVGSSVIIGFILGTLAWERKYPDRAKDDAIALEETCCVRDRPCTFMVKAVR